MTRFLSVKPDNDLFPYNEKTTSSNMTPNNYFAIKYTNLILAMSIIWLNENSLHLLHVVSISLKKNIDAN